MKLPLKIERNHAGKVIGISAADMAHDLDFVCYISDEENAKRIVACVNACAGVPTEKFWLSYPEQEDKPKMSIEEKYALIEKRFKEIEKFIKP